MIKTHTIADQLRTQASLLYAFALQADPVLEHRAAELEKLIHDAQAREHRRAAFNARDASCYRLGSAFEPTGGLDLDPVAVAGLMALGATGLLLLVRVALASPDASLAEHLRALFRSRAGRAIRAWGVWSRWHWLRALYLHQTEVFLNSPSGRDPKARWRAKPPTAEQTYLVTQISLDLQLQPRSFATRGEAFDWIQAAGGNPRFRTEAGKPDLSEVAELLA
ncbi:hypothetical protein [Sphingomonas bacterium]|uniref:hypothetical protein n=1 Tax=Sphingomonas bacterium TaxID=1895847 RepID=UPI0015767275|nr:hypothetical protein [Sphingomonas bacterium]